MQTFELERIPTPVGTMLIATDAEGALRAVDWEDYEARMLLLFQRQLGAVQLVERSEPSTARRAIERYLGGELDALQTLPVVFGGTPFQRRVWDALRSIPVGETVSYGELARRLALPKAARAVGLANGQNPISVVVPCHRVIGVNATLTGYAGGLARKRWLLQHEGVSV